MSLSLVHSVRWSLRRACCRVTHGHFSIGIRTAAAPYSLGPHSTKPARRCV